MPVAAGAHSTQPFFEIHDIRLAAGFCDPLPPSEKGDRGGLFAIAC